MPTVIVTTHRAAAASPELLTALSRTVAEATAKDERWVMTSLVRSEAMTYGGEDVPAAFVRVVSIGGFSDDAARAVVAGVTAEVSSNLGVPPSHVYVELSAASAPRFGCNGELFG